MQQREKIFHLFLFFFAVAFLIFLFSQSTPVKGVSGLLEQVTSPFRKATFFLFSAKPGNTPEDKLRERIKKLESQVASYQSLEKDNKALRDQFETTDISSDTLLPASVVGLVAFVPGVSPAEQMIIDKGEKDGVKTGDVVVFQKNLIGKIISVYPHVSKLNLISQKDITVTAQTSKTSAIGLAAGGGSGEIVLENVVLSDKLEKDDLVVTKGDMDEKGNGYPPDLVIGKITSVNKRASDLFQIAEIESLIDFSKLKMVFVMKH